MGYNISIYLRMTIPSVLKSMENLIWNLPRKIQNIWDVSLTVHTLENRGGLASHSQPLMLNIKEPYSKCWLKSIVHRIMIEFTFWKLSQGNWWTVCLCLLRLHYAPLQRYMGYLCTRKAQYAPWCTRETIFFEKFKGPWWFFEKFRGPWWFFVLVVHK